MSSTALRWAAVIAAIMLLALFLMPTSRAARPLASAADKTLLDAANRDRAAAHLPALQWDSALAAAARQHALRMAKANALSHQFPGEPPMQDRARQAGARFSLIAENVAQGPSVDGLHTQWMNSPPHRANLLDSQLNFVGISVVQAGNIYFAVEDFSANVPTLTLDAQEHEVASQLAAHGLRSANSTVDARKTCALDHGWAGRKPARLLRYETADLTRLPDDIAQQLDSGRYHSAAVGACDASSSRVFTRFRVAILLF